MIIKNIVLDIGNVLLRWEPAPAILDIFPGFNEKLIKELFYCSTWQSLSRGEINEKEAIRQYALALNLHSSIIESLLDQARKSLLPLNDSVRLVESLYNAHFPLFILSDNTEENMRYLKAKYDFWKMFLGIVVSAEVGHLKPSPLIYNHLLDSYNLNPTETLFIDDLSINVDGAKALGMHGIVFENITQCIQDLNKLNIKL